MRKHFSQIYIWTSKKFIFEREICFPPPLFFFSFSSFTSKVGLQGPVASLAFGLFCWMLEHVFVTHSCIWFPGYPRNLQKDLKYLWLILCWQQVCIFCSCLCIFPHAYCSSRPSLLTSVFMVDWFSFSFHVGQYVADSQIC